MFDTRIPKPFKKNYLTNQIAMKVAGKLSGDLYTNIAEKLTRNALTTILEKETSRSFTDCMEHVKGLPETQIGEFMAKARKFVK